jgi:hypothetical protein
MSQVHRSAIARPLVGHGRPFVLGAIFFASVLAAAILSAALIFTSMTAAPATIRGGGGDLVDGWMSAAGSARAAQLDRTQDGYLPGLLSARPELVDGWMPEFAGAGAEDPRDGWEARLTD